MGEKGETEQLVNIFMASSIDLRYLWKINAEKTRAGLSGYL